MFGPVTYDKTSGVWSCDIDANCRLVSDTKHGLELSMDVAENYMRANGTWQGSRGGD